MAYSEIPSSDIEVGKPVKKSLWQKIRDNFIDHENRIAALSAGANKIQVVDYNFDSQNLEVGRVVASRMSLSQFQDIHGDGWVLCDGGSASGSLYATITGLTTVPDYRSEFLRGANGSSVILGSKYSDATAKNGLSASTNTTGSHTHTYESFVDNSATDELNDTSLSIGSRARDTRNTRTSSSNGSHSHTVTITGDSETRPQNEGVNFFICIDLSTKDKIIRIKARESFTITNIKGYLVDNAGLPTSGNFEFDIKVGSTIAGLSSIFSVKPVLAYSGGIADGDATSSGTVVSGGYDVTAGDWIQIDITSIMVGQSGYMLSIFGEPA